MVVQPKSVHERSGVEGSYSTHSQLFFSSLRLVSVLIGEVWSIWSVLHPFPIWNTESLLQSLTTTGDTHWSFYCPPMIMDSAFLNFDNHWLDFSDLVLHPSMTDLQWNDQKLVVFPTTNANNHQHSPISNTALKSSETPLKPYSADLLIRVILCIFEQF